MQRYKTSSKPAKKPNVKPMKHSDEKEDMALIKKTVKKSALKKGKK